MPSHCIYLLLLLLCFFPSLHSLPMMCCVREFFMRQERNYNSFSLSFMNFSPLEFISTFLTLFFLPKITLKWHKFKKLFQVQKSFFTSNRSRLCIFFFGLKIFFKETDRRTTVHHEWGDFYRFLSMWHSYWNL